MKDSVYIKAYSIICHNDKIIMTQDTEGQPGWKFPGGHLEEKELLFEAAKREFLEETGYEISLDNLLLVEDFFNNKRPNEHNMRIFLIGHTVGGKEKLKFDEVCAIKYFDSSEIKSLLEKEVYPPHWNALNKYFQGSFPIEIIEATDK